MPQHYSDPRRADDAYSLPDLEVWQDKVYSIECRCGNYEIPEPASFDGVICPSCMRTPLFCGGISDTQGNAKLGWFWWTCFPGCMPEGDGYPNGPFATEAEALADAREGMDDDN